ncbi:Ornithine decarboxylase antizyme 1, partial [Trichinella pseudospiralis]
LLILRLSVGLVVLQLLFLSLSFSLCVCICLFENAASNSEKLWCAEGSGVGFKTEPSVLNSDLCMQQFLNNSLQSFEAVRLKFIIGVTDGIENIWNAIIVSPKCIHLYVTLTDVALLSRKGFISVLEFVTETLKLEEIYLVIDKERSDRALLIRSFSYFGFRTVAPGETPMNNAEEVIFMKYTDA